MRVILGHNHYRSSAPSGEDSAFHNERRLLEKKGIDVIPFEYFNDDIDDSTILKKLRLAQESGWSRRSYRVLSDLIRKTRPDIFHLEINVMPLLNVQFKS